MEVAFHAAQFYIMLTPKLNCTLRSTYVVIVGEFPILHKTCISVQLYCTPELHKLQSPTAVKLSYSLQVNIV